MFCCLDQSDSLLKFLKKKYQWDTVPMIIQKDTDTNDEVFIGGFTDLVEHFKNDK